jgi:phosphonate degradation associated HDIG domain protein
MLMTAPADRLPLPAVDSVEDFVNQIRQVFTSRGNDHYGEDVSQREHAEQCAYYARADGAGDELVIAALLHDIGHLMHKFGQDAADRGIDTKHERIGSGFLARALPAGVTEPIALHVRAKRYLATTNPAYLEGLSGASMQSFILQGGVMSLEEVDAFLAEPYHLEALKLRSYDELGKVIGLEIPSFESYETVLRGLIH